MSEKETLYLVERWHRDRLEPSKVVVFRTREAARMYQKSRRPNQFTAWKIRRSTWGPEQ